MTPVTRLMLRISLSQQAEDRVLQLRADVDKDELIREHIVPAGLPAIQRAIRSLLPSQELHKDDALECIVLKEADCIYRLVWPHLFVQCDKQGEVLTNAIRKLISAEEEEKNLKGEDEKGLHAEEEKGKDKEREKEKEHDETESTKKTTLMEQAKGVPELSWLKNCMQIEEGGSMYGQSRAYVRMIGASTLQPSPSSQSSSSGGGAKEQCDVQVIGYFDETGHSTVTQGEDTPSQRKAEQLTPKDWLKDVSVLSPASSPWVPSPWESVRN